MELTNRVWNVIAGISTTKRAIITGLLLDDEFKRNKDFVLDAQSMGVDRWKEYSSTLHRIIMPSDLAHVRSNVTDVCGKKRKVYFWSQSPLTKDIGSLCARFILKSAIEYDIDIDRLFTNPYSSSSTSGVHRIVLLDYLTQNKGKHVRSTDVKERLYSQGMHPNYEDHIIPLEELGLIQVERNSWKEEFRYRMTEENHLPVHWYGKLTKKVVNALSDDSKTIGELLISTGANQGSIIKVLNGLKHQGSVTEVDGHDALLRSSIKILPGGLFVYKHVLNPIVSAIEGDYDSYAKLHTEAKYNDVSRKVEELF